MLHLTAALDPASRVPLYQQLYRSLAGEIRSGALPAGTRMPGKRSLAEALGVSVTRWTGPIRCWQPKGIWPAGPAAAFMCRNIPPCRAVPSRRQPRRLRLRPPVRRVQYDLSTGGVDTRLFPFRTWARLQKELLYTSPGSCWPGATPGGISSCGRPWRAIWRSTAGCAVPPARSWWGRASNTCSACWPSAAGTCGGGGTRATPGPGRCWKTAAGPAG